MDVGCFWVVREGLYHGGCIIKKWLGLLSIRLTLVLLNNICTAEEIQRNDEHYLHRSLETSIRDSKPVAFSCICWKSSPLINHTIILMILPEVEKMLQWWQFILWEMVTITLSIFSLTVYPLLDGVFYLRTYFHTVLYHYWVGSSCIKAR